MRNAVFALLLALSGQLVWAQEQSASPGINSHYRNPDFERWVATFETAGREVYDKRHEIVAALELQPGMNVADVGAGTGLFTLLLARKVGAGGTALAQDISAEFLRGIAARARQAGLANVRTVEGSDRDARLPPAALDLIFVCDTYHHFEYPQAMLASLHAALKPGGRLAVIDYEKIPGRSSAWVMGHVRADRAQAIAEIEAAGFRLVRSHAMLQSNYFLEFQKP